MIMYDDDITMFCDITETQADEHLLNLQQCKINDLLFSNKLSLNLNKANDMFFVFIIRQYYFQNSVLMLVNFNVLTILTNFLVCNQTTSQSGMNP